jgi:hypothetical protein
MLRISASALTAAATSGPAPLLPSMHLSGAATPTALLAALSLAPAC